MLLMIILSVLIVQVSSAQPCPPSVFFTTQAEIDNFPIQYPNCKEILGEVQITGDNITNLNGLNAITYIGGGLTIWYTSNLVDLSGLENLTEVDALVISENDALTEISSLSNLAQIHSWITIIGNPNLNSLEGLEQITSIPVWWVNISDNDNLINLDGLNNLNYVNQLYVGNNDNIIDLSGFENLDSVFWLDIGDNDNLQNLNGLSSLSKVSHHLSIYSNNVLNSLTGFEQLTHIDGGLRIEENDALESMEGLEGIETIGGVFEISHNYDLQSLNGLESLKQVGGSLRVVGCNELISLSGLDSLTMIGGWLNIDENNLLETLSGTDNIEAESIENLSITYNPQLSTCEVQSVCDYLANPGGDIQIYVNAPGCNNSVEVEEACTVGIPEQETVSRLSLYPNPSFSEVTISRVEGIIDEVSIYNKLGQRVIHEVKPHHTIDVSGLPQGLYIVEIEWDGYQVRKKLIVQ